MIVASILPEGATHWFRAACPSLDFLSLDVAQIGSGVRGATILLTTHSALGRQVDRPAAWPFGLRWVHLLTSGLDGYPEWLFDGVPVTHSPGISAQPIAEYCMAAIFASARDFPARWIRDAGHWAATSSRLIAGQTVGIVGFGEVGKALAARALALGMNVQATRRSSAPLPPGICRAASTEALFASSDHIVLALPASAETRGMVNRDLLRQARQGAHLINVARGSLVDQEALIEALDAGWLARASLDVTNPEPLPAGHPLYTHARVFLTPHVAANDETYPGRLAEAFAENTRRFMGGAPLLYPARTAVHHRSLC